MKKLYTQRSEKSLNISTSLLYGSNLLLNGGVMGRPKEIKDGTRLSVVRSKHQAERVKHMALRMSTQEGRQITVSEAIRMAVEAVYPVPKNQMTMFD